MPNEEKKTWVVKDPYTGKELEITGDTPPTEKELVEIFAQYKPAQQPQEEKGSVFDSLGQGLSFGFADEFAGAVGAIPASIATGESIGDAYRGIRDEARGNAASFSERNPKTALAAEVGGGLLTGGVGAVKAGGASLARSIPKLMGAGAGTGAVAGAGYSEGGTAGEVARDAATGAAIGAAGGGLLPPVAKGVGRAITAPLRHAQASRVARPVAKIGEAIARDDSTPEKVAAKLRKMPSGAAIADAGGDSVQTLGRDITVQPGKARNIARNLFEGRRKLAPERIDTAVRAALNQKGEFHTARKALEEKMKSVAAPLYEKAYKQPVNVTPRLEALLKRDSMKRAIQEGQKMAAEEGGKVGGHIQILDYAKRALDDQIDVAMRAGEKQKARAIRGTKNALLKELDLQVPVYAEARSAFAGPKRLEEALELGRKFMREDAEIIEDLLAEMGASEKQFFRMGAIRHLRDAVLSKSDTADAYKAIFNTPLKRKKVEALFPNTKKFVQFQRAMQGEAKMFETGSKAMANSSTANKQSGVADLALSPEILVDAASGGGTIAAINAIKIFLRRHAPSIKNEKMRDEIAALLFSADPGKQQQILKSIGARAGALEFRGADAAANFGAIAGSPAIVSQSN